MEEDNRSPKQLIMAVLAKCKDALPELAVLTKKIEKMNMMSSPKDAQKVRKKDCLNPTFLIKLSQCGQNIRLILQNAVSIQFAGRQTLKRYFNQYMQVIYDIRRYHEQAHNNHDMHKNSTQMKRNLLQQLQEQTAKRQHLQQHLQDIVDQYQKELGEKQIRIHQLEDALRDRDDINLSHISKISKKVDREFYGQFYGNDKMNKSQEDQEVVRLRNRVKELEELLRRKQKVHQAQLDNHKQGILELQSKFEQLMKTTSYQNNQSLKLQTLHSLRNDRKSLNSFQNDISDVYRMISIQAVTIEQFLNEQSQ